MLRPFCALGRVPRRWADLPTCAASYACHAIGLVVRTLEGWRELMSVLSNGPLHNRNQACVRNASSSEGTPGLAFPNAAPASGSSGRPTSGCGRGPLSPAHRSTRGQLRSLHRNDPAAEEARRGWPRWAPGALLRQIAAIGSPHGDTVRRSVDMSAHVAARALIALGSRT